MKSSRLRILGIPPAIAAAVNQTTLPLFELDGSRVFRVIGRGQAILSYFANAKNYFAFAFSEDDSTESATQKIAEAYNEFSQMEAS